MPGQVGRLFLIAVFLGMSGAASARSFVADGYDPYGTARVMDPLHDIYPRAQVKGAYRSEFGTQFQGCTERIQKHLGLSKDVAEKRIENLIRTGVERILACQTKYPELTPYLKDWIAHARRTVWVCVDKEKINDRQVINPALLTGFELFAESPRAHGVMDLDPFESTARNYKTTLPVGTSFLKNGFAEEPGVFETYGFIHEIFHDTTLNNNGITHNSTEEIDYDAKKACELNVLDDRVETVSSLCMERPAEGEDPKRYDAVLFDRMNRCGIKRGCLDLFAGPGVADSLIEHYAPSKSIPEADARRLCERISEEQACVERMRGNRITLLRNDPELQKIGRKLFARVDQILPRGKNDIPIEFLKTRPTYLKGLQAVSSTRCFKWIFTTGADGTLYLRGGSNPSEYTPKEREYGSYRVLETDRLGDPQCAGTREGLLISEAIQSYRGTLYHLHESYLYNFLIRPRVFRGDPEQISWEPERTADSVRESEYANQVFGRDLVAEYLSALRKYHEDQALPYCASAAAKPKSAIGDMGRMQGLIDGLLDPAQASCPAR